MESLEELGDPRVLPGACETKVDCVEALRRSILAQGFSEKVADTAAKGRRESTRRIYGARASHFARWCAAWAVDPYTAPVSRFPYGSRYIAAQRETYGSFNYSGL